MRFARALVTGASSGIGRAYAEALAAEGTELVLVARRRERLEELAGRLPAKAEVVVSDLGTPEGLAAAAGAVEGVDLLVNNAGFGAYMPFVELPPERAEEQLRVQVVAPTLLARAALPGMLERGGGAVINVASMLAFSAAFQLPQLRRATYTASKAYLVAFSQQLQQEVGDRVRIQVCCPGVVATEFHSVQGMDSSHAPGRLEPEDVVRASLRGLDLGELICAPALEDTSLIERWIEAANALFGGGRGDLATRYR